MPFQNIRNLIHEPKRRGLVAALVAGALAVSIGGVATAPARAATATPPAKPAASKSAAKSATPKSTTPAAPLHAATQADAAARARASGEPVVVDAETTETVQVTANPNGTFTLASNAQPVRVKRGAGWVPIDPTLKKNPDGSLSPAAATDAVAFSGGGTRPLAVVTDPKTAKSVSISWPGTLPAPAVSGASATYPGVLPGVDLRVTATGTGYSEVLIVHNAAAAHNPKLASLAFGLHGNGLNLKSRADGTVAATDPKTGSTVFSTLPAIMWDSTVDANRGQAPTADTAGSGRVNPLAISLAAQGTNSTTLTVAPPTAALTGSKVAYPIYIDPQLGGTPPEHWAELANFPKTWWDSTDLPNGNTELGYCGYSSCVYDYNGHTETSALFRDYFQMDTTPLSQGNGTTAIVYAATFYADETYNSAHCTSENVALYTAGPIGPATTWGNQIAGGWMDTEPSNAGGGSGCGAGDVVFGSANPNDGNAVNVSNYAQSAANSHWNNLTFELRAEDEGNTYQFKNFADNPVFYVTYNFPPNAPTGLTVSHAVTCNSGGMFTSDAYPTLYASATDNNPAPLDLNLWFQFWNVPGTVEQAANSSGVTIGSGSQGQWTSNVQFANGTGLAARVDASNITPANDGSLSRTGPWSNSIFFTVLTETPVTPSVSSFDYPAGQWGQAQGTPGVITVNGDGTPNLAGFAYSIDGGAASEPVPSDGDCGYLADGGLGTSTTANNATSGELASAGDGTAQVRIPTGLAVGPHTLYVKSFDFAHNASGETAYRFYVAPNYQTATQQPTRIEAEGLLPATGSGAANASEQLNCCNVGWSNGAQVLFDNAAAGGTFTLTFNVPNTDPATGTWDLAVNETTAPDFGAMRYDLDGTTNLAGSATLPFDAFSPIVSEHLVDLGTLALAPGPHTLTFTVVTKNGSSSNYRAGIDYISLAPTNRYEAESLPTTPPSAGSLVLQPWPHPGQFSGNNQLFLENTAAGSHFTISFNAPVESDYALGVNLVTATDYGTLRFDLDPASANINLDNTATAPIDAYRASVTTKYVFLGGVHLTAGTHVLKVTVAGTDASSVGNRYNAGIDYVEAAPVTGAKSGSFTAAMNNHGITSDGSATTANFDLTSGSTLSLQALQAAGITPGTASAPGSTFTLGGATFTMPQLNADGDDNVIADGQTVPLPAVKATDVALLATATCFYAPASTATLHYTGAQPSQPAIPVTGDWLAGPGNSAAMQLNHRDLGSGSTVLTDVKPKLYELLLPANPDAPLSSITLPLMSPSFLTGTACQNTAALHILAVGTRSVAAGPSGSTWVGAYAGPIDAAILPPNPPNPEYPPGDLSSWTLRTSVPLSVTGSGQTRVRLSNTHATNPVTFDAATIAAQSSGGGAATVATPVALTFCLANGQPLGCTGSAATSIMLPAGGDAYSDPAARPTGGSGNLTISLHISSSSTVANTPVHENSTATTYLTSTDATGTNQDGSAYNGSAAAWPDVYYVSGIDVSDTTSGDGTVAVLGDQTASTGSPTWEQDLPSALEAQSVPLPGGLVNTSMQGPEPAPTAHWLLGERGGNAAYDSASGGAHNATITTVTTNGTANPSWSADSPAFQSSIGSLEFNGVGNGYAATSGPVIDTTKSYTVSAWVRLEGKTGAWQTAVVQQANTSGGFYLEYDATNDRWSFSLAESDTTNPTVVRTESLASPVVGAWTHLTGMYSVANKAMALWVNGTPQNGAAFTTPIASNGPLVIGRGYSNGQPGNYFDGEISDVRVFATDMNTTDIDRSYADNGTSPVPTWQAISAFETNAYAEPNLRDVIVSLGAADVMQGVPEQQIEANLSTLITYLKGRQVANQPSTPLTVYITTIQPLALPSGDPRETTRNDVNTWILHNSGATAAIDTTTANGDPSKTATLIASALSGPGL